MAENTAYTFAQWLEFGEIFDCAGNQVGIGKAVECSFKLREYSVQHR